MASIDLSQSPYNDKYDASKRYSMVLYRAGRPALAQELTEQQSMQENQLQMLGNTLFSEGAIISGMDIVQQPSDSGSTSGMPNNFSISSLEAINAKVNTGTYTSDGNLVVTSTATLSTDYPEVQFVGTITKGLYMTLSFTVQKVSGNLKKISLNYDSNSVTPISYTIDGTSIKTSLNDNTASLLVSSTGSQINLDDSKSHKVVVTFKTLVSGSPTFSFYVNGGYDALQIPVSLNWSKVYVEDGQSATDWQINANDADANSTVNRSKNYLVTAGQVYLAGAVREFDAQTISIKGTGTETIGVKLNEDIVTSSDDPDLLDTTEGAITNGMAGADRLHYQVVLTYNDDSSTPIYVFQDNKVNSNGIKPQYDNITNILAKRTYDQSGSFRVSGFGVTVKDYSLDDSKLELAIDAGQAYVRGYSIATSSTQSVLVDKSYTTGTATNDTFVYASDTASYQLTNQPIQEVTNVTGYIEGQNASVTRSSGSSVDTFTTEDAYQVTSVTKAGVTYTAGTDYVVSNNTIIWGEDASGNTLPNANIPASGSTYTVNYRYTKSLTAGTDYKLVTTTNDLGMTITSVDIKDMSGLKPIPGTSILVNYVYFLAREDMVLITADDTNPFKVVQGTPAPLTSVAPPTLSDPYSLELGYVLVYPNMDKGLFVSQTTDNITFSNLTKWSSRLNNLEDNVVSLALQNAVEKSTDNTSQYLKDNFADAFNSVDMADNTNADFNVAYDFELGQITIPAKAYAEMTPTVSSDSSDINTKGNLITAPYTEETVINQNQITGTLNVNEYEVFNTMGSLSLDPSSDNWIDTTSTVVENDTNGGAVSFSRWWRHNVYDTNGASESANMVLENNMEGVTYGYNAAAVQTGYVISSGGSKTVESLIEYIRERTISFTAKNFLPYADDFSITIEGIPVLNPTPASSTYKGSATNTFKADGNGIVKGSFTIPGGTIKCGTRTVKIYNPTGASATASYTAQGTLKNTESIILKTTYAVTLVDPLAQSFTLSDTRFLTSVDLYFATKATTNDSSHTSDVTVEIRELSDDGYPNKTIKGSQTLTPDDINVSSDGSAVTKVTFDNAIALTANQGYAICILTDSNAYNMYVAQQGKSLIGTSTILQANPNSNGDLFTSNNAQTWSADGTTSLKFAVNCAYYNTSGTILFDPITLSDESYENDSSDSVTKIDHFVALTTFLTPQQTSMTWYYRVLPSSSSSTIDNMPWQALIPANDNTELESYKKLLEASKEMQLKATFTATKYVSPILTTEDLSLAGMLTGTEGKYYSVNMDESDSDAQFNHVKVQFDAYVPTGTSVTPYYSVDGGNNYYTLEDDGTSASTPTATTQLSSSWTRYTYECSVPSATDINHYAKQFKVYLDLKASTNFVIPAVRQLTALLSVD